MIIRFRTVALGCIVSGAFLGACANAGPEETQDYVVRDSAGTEIVVNHAPEWGEAEGWGISEEPVVRIGAVSSSDPAYQFSWISSAGRLSDGRIVVLDGQAAEIRWFDVEGNHLRSSGGPGPGPGEFNYASGMLVLPGDTVVVEDRPRVVHVFFDPDGNFLREEPFDHERMSGMGDWVECAAMTLPDRSRVVCQQEPGQPAAVADPGPGHFRRMFRMVRVSWDLEEVDTLGLQGGIEQWGIRSGDRTTFGMHPFYSNGFAAAGGDPLRVAIARNPEYSIELWRPDGGLDRIVRRSDGRRAATDEESAAAEDMLAERFRGRIPSPDSIPAVMGLWLSQQGDLIVRRIETFGEDFRFAYDVFDAEGRWLGEVSLPQRFQIEDVGEDYILGVRRDEMDVPYVELYSLVRNGSVAAASTASSGNHLAAVSGSQSPARPIR